jgi:predicted phosphodiesterase
MKIMIIGDVHVPFMHKYYMDFLKDVQKSEKPDKIIFIGDLLDHHALARWTSDPEGFSAGHEQMESQKQLETIYEAFPEATWIEGNHDKRPFNKAFEFGVPSSMIRPLTDIYCSPPGWDFKQEVYIDGVLFTHGEGAGGEVGWQKYAKEIGNSVVVGHYHGVGGIRYLTLKGGKVLFTMVTGCGVDEHAYAMAYGKHSKNRPMLGCGIVTNGKYAKFLPLDVELYDEKERIHDYESLEFI